MSMPDIHYIFQDDVTYAIHQGKVIAASTDTDEVQRQVKRALMPPDSRGDMGMPPGSPPGGMADPGMDQGGMPGMPGMDQGAGDSCPECGAPIDPATGEFCLNCGAPSQGGQQIEMPPPPPDMGIGGPGGPEAPGGGPQGPPHGMMAKVTTPSGLKGTVLGKVAGLWGDEVTIRLENGRIVKLPVGVELNAVKQAAAPKVTPIVQLEARLAATPDGTRASLVSREQDLYRIRTAASQLICEGASLADASHLDRLVVTADVERAEVRDAIAHLDDVESIAAPGFTMAAASRTTDASNEDASWLDSVLDDMIKEAEATDFSKLMDEGPEAFTAELPDVALADVGVTRQMASSFIAEKTAGVDRTIAAPYMVTFLARVEQCRKSELSGRKQTTHKEAAATEDKFKDLPDDALFL